MYGTRNGSSATNGGGAWRIEALGQGASGRHLDQRSSAGFGAGDCRNRAIDTVQVIYNIFDQTPGTQFVSAGDARDVGVIARVPLDEGSLTGTIDENTRFAPGDFREGYFKGDRKRQVREHVEDLLRDLGVEAAALPEIALRFCLSNPAVSTVIPGMRSVRNAEANCETPERGALAADLLAVLKGHAWDRNFYD